VTQDLGRPDHRSGVIAHTHNRIGADIPRVREHQLERLFARSFAQAGEYPGSPAEQRPQPADNREWKRARAHRDSTHDTQALDDAQSGQFERGRRQNPAGLQRSPDLGRHLIACGLIGDPVPPVMISGGPQKKNS
jgi:hypothetical protein